MKRLGRFIGSLFAMALMATALQAMAETQLGGRNFDHTNTGFPLSGGHATAACETCHIGGVFKGTPKTCDGCHAVGKHIVATPKSNAHIVTDAPCETCHFSAATWLGARYNHSSAMPGSCTSCHNGRGARGKPASHNSGKKATGSCDSCHRSSAFLPASWNHIGVAPGTCATCHNGSSAPGKTASHTGQKGLLPCDDCHRMTGWLPAAYNHRGVVPGSCANCHNGAAAKGKPASHTGAKATLPCDDCHRVTSWLPATYNHRGVLPGSCVTCHNGSSARGKTASHTRVGMATYNCDDCHTNFVSWLPAIYRHTAPSPTGRCDGCHNNAIAAGTASKPGHIAIGTDDCNQCHASTASWLPALGGKPANHIPYNAGVSCSNCHVGVAKVNRNTLHTYSVGSSTCATCHISPNAYTGSPNAQKTKKTHKGSSGNNCSSCHGGAASYSNWNA